MHLDTTLVHRLKELAAIAVDVAVIVVTVAADVDIVAVVIVGFVIISARYC